MYSELNKKPSSFKIGVFTVFIVVMVITMLKSVVDSAPILFVKLGQDEVGAIDFTLKASNTATKQVPINYYNINPFLGQFGSEFKPEPSSNSHWTTSPNGDDSGLLDTCSESDIEGIYEVCEDHFELDDGTVWLKNDYFDQ